MVYDASLGSHFNDWIDHNGAAFSIVTRMGPHIFGILRPSAENYGRKGFKNGRFFSTLILNKCVNSFKDDLVERLYKIDA